MVDQVERDLSGSDKLGLDIKVGDLCTVVDNLY